MKKPPWFIACSIALTRGRNKTHVVVAFLLLGLFGGIAGYDLGAAQTSPGVTYIVPCQFTSGPMAGTTRTLLSQVPLAPGSQCAAYDSNGLLSYGVVVTPPLGNTTGYPGAPGNSQQPPPVGQGAPPGIPIDGSPPPGSPPPPPPSPPPPRAGDGGSHEGKKGNDDSMPRVTGTAILLPNETETAGYGLYSYALISHRPQPGELPKYRAYFGALLLLPTAESVERYVPRRRINVTYLPLDSLTPSWFTMPFNDRIDYAIDHYDYARGAAMIACLSQHIGPGPGIISLLKPLDLSSHPHPVLVQDLTAAQPSLIATYVRYFVQQAAKDQFWQESALAHFSLSLRNGLEVAAEGLGQSKTAVDSWVKFFH